MPTLTGETCFGFWTAEVDSTQGGAAWQIFEDLGIPLVLIKDSFDESPPQEAYSTGTDCLSYGLYGEIRHNGDIQLCSDSYGNPEYTIGNIFEDDLRNIWTSDRRKQVLAERNQKKCFQTACPHNSRGHHHNRVFHQIEQFRGEGRMPRCDAGWKIYERSPTHWATHSSCEVT